MPNYTVEIEVTCRYYVEVEAKDADEAEKKAESIELNDLQSFDETVEYYATEID